MLTTGVVVCDLTTLQVAIWTTMPVGPLVRPVEIPGPNVVSESSTAVPFSRYLDGPTAEPGA